MKWEYAVDRIVESRLTVLLEQRGREGWELVQILQDANVNVQSMTLFFKRPVE